MRLALQAGVKPPERATPRAAGCAFASVQLPVPAGQDRQLRRKASHCACGGSCPRCQAKSDLKISEPDDQYEREADDVAQRVVGGLTATPSAATGPLPLVQRVSTLVSPTEDDGEVGPGLEEGEPLVMRLSIPGSEAVPARRALEPRLIARMTAGRTLPPVISQTLGDRMGADLSRVRIHDDGQAAEIAREVQARAFTWRQHIYFGAGEYRPHQREGLHVLAHELAHVLQQGAAPVPLLAGNAAIAGRTGPHALQRMSVLDHTGPENIVAVDKRPWSGDAPRGNDYRVYTDAGSEVTAWVPYSGTPEAHCYWCHGFSLGTYAQWSYSVYSGSGMRQVVADDFSAVPRDQARAGDLAVWTTTADGVPFGHSAKFTRPVVTGGTLDEAQSRLDTKNGQAPLANSSLADIIAVPAYGSQYEVFRRR